ncbi:MAG: TonB-dependent receptor, partial [Alphaproteobacteria bacterium]|nr:TonB-dependent receptor [Alphaproteobacteria bacterium]
DAARGYCSYAGLTNQFVAKYSGTFGLDHYYDIDNDLTLHSSVNLFYTSSYYADPTLDPSLIQGAYVRLDARIGLGQPDGIWEVALLAKNLNDVRPITFATATPLAYSVFGAKSSLAYVGEGRTFVLQGKVRF